MLLYTCSIFVGSQYPISESMQTLNGMNGENVLSNNNNKPSYHDDGDYHRLDTNPPSNGYYDSSQTEFYPQHPEQKYRPPLMRMNSGKKINFSQYETLLKRM